jgi:hypothetical protein
MNRRKAVEKAVQYVEWIAREQRGGDKAEFFRELSFHFSELADIANNPNPRQVLSLLKSNSQ